MAIQDCPCGRGPYAQCCGPLLMGAARAETAEDLMRSRYTAFVLHDADHLFRTWHPRTRPADIDASGGGWLGLTILDVVGGGPDEATGEVEFEARHEHGALRERSRFARRAGRWMYVDGDVED